MANEVDSRVVELKFENKQFEEAVSKSLATLNNLKEALNFKKLDTSSLEKVQKTVNDMDFSHIEKSLDSLESRFSTFGIVGMTAIQKLTSSVMDMGMKIAGAIPNQLVQGALKRAGGIKQAQFQLKGLGINWDDIKDDIDYGVKDTAYSLDAAAKAASMLSASGVRVGDSMKQSLRGISGVASMTNQSYEMISDIFTTVAGKGVLMGSELTRLGYYGLNAAATLKDYLQQNAEQYQYLFNTNRYGYKSMAEATEEDIRDLASQRAITYEMFAAAMDSAYGQHAKDANEMFQGALANVKAALARTFVDVADAGYDAATKVLNAFRTVINSVNPLLKPINEMLINTMSSFANFWESVLNGFNDTVKAGGLDGFMKEINSIIEYILMAIGRVADDLRIAVSPLLRIFKTLVNTFIFPLIHAIEVPAWGAIRAFVQAVGAALENIILPAIQGITHAFRDSGLFNLIGTIIERIANVFSALEAAFKKIGESDSFLYIFYGAFSVISLALEGFLSVLEIVITAVRDFIAYTAPISAAIFNVFGAIYRFISSIISSIQKTNVIKTIYDSIIKIITPFADILQGAIVGFLNFIASVIDGANQLGIFQAVISAVSGIFKFIVGVVETVVGVFYDFYQAVKDTVRESGILQAVLEGVKTAVEFVYGAFKAVADKLAPIIKGIGDMISGIFKPVEDSGPRVGKFKDMIIKAVEKVQNAFKRAKNIIVPIFQDIVRIVKPIIEDLMSRIGPIIQPMFEKLKDGASSFVTALEGIAQSEKPFEKLVEFLNPFKNIDFGKIGSDLSGFMTGTLPNIFLKAGEKISKIDILGSIFKLFSPTKAYADTMSDIDATGVGEEMGEKLATSMQSGIESGAKKSAEGFNPISMIQSTLTPYVDAFLSDARRIFGDAIKMATDAINTAIDYIYDNFSSLAPKIKWIVDVFFTVELARLFGTLRKVLEKGDPLGLGNMAKNAFRPFQTIAEGIRDVGQGIKRALTGAMIVELAVAVGLIVDAIDKLSKALENPNFAGAAIGVAVITGIVVAIAIFLDKMIEVKRSVEKVEGVPAGISGLLNGIKDAIADASKGFKIAGIGAGIAGIAAAVWIIVDIIQKLEDLNIGANLPALLGKLAIIALIIGGLSAVAIAMGKFGKNIFAAGAGIFLAAAAVGVIVHVIDKLQELQTKLNTLGRGEALKQGIDTVREIMIQLGVLIGSLGILSGKISLGGFFAKGGDLVNVGIALAAAAGSIWIISEALSKLASIKDMGKLTTSMEALKTLFDTLAGGLVAVTLATSGFSGALSGLFSAFGVFGGVLGDIFPPLQKLLGNGQGGGLFGKLLGMFKGEGSAGGSLSGSFKKSHTNIMKVAQAILLAAAAFAVLAGALFILSNPLVDINKMQAGAIALGVLFTLLSGALAGLAIAASKLQLDLMGAAEALVFASLAFIVLAYSIYMIGQSGLDSNGIANAGAALAVMFAVMGASLVLLAKYAKMSGEELLMAAGALVIASAAFAVLALALYIAGQATANGTELAVITTMLISMFVVLAGALLLFSVIAEGTSTGLLEAAGALVIASAAFVVLAAALAIAAESAKDANAFTLAAVALTAMFAIMAGVLVGLTFLAAGTGPAMALAAAAMVALSLAMYILSEGVKNLATAFDTMVEALNKLNNINVDFGSLTAKLALLLGVLTYMSSTAFVAGISNIFGGPDALKKFAETIDKFADAMKKLNELDANTDKINQAVDKIVEVIDKMANIRPDWSTAFGGADEMSKFGTAVKNMAEAFKMVEDLAIDAEALNEPINKITEVLEKLSGAADGLGDKKESAKMGGIFGWLSGYESESFEGGKAENLQKLSNSIKPIADAMQQLANLDLESSGKYEANIDSMKRFIDKIKEWANEFGNGTIDGGNFLEAGVGRLSELAPSIAAIGTTLSQVASSAMTVGDPDTFGNYMGKVSDFIHAIKEHAMALGTGGSDQGVANLKNMLDGIGGLPDLMRQISEVMVGNEDMGQAPLDPAKIEQFKNMATDIIGILDDEAIKRLGQEGADKAVSNFQNIGMGFQQLTSAFQSIATMEVPDGVDLGDRITKFNSFIEGVKGIIQSLTETSNVQGGSANSKFIDGDAFKNIASGIGDLTWSFAEIAKMPDLDAEKMGKIVESMKGLMTTFAEMAGIGNTENSMLGGDTIGAAKEKGNMFKNLSDGIKGLAETMQMISEIDFKGGEEGGGLDEKLQSMTNFIKDFAGQAEGMEKAAASMKVLASALSGEGETEGLVSSLNKFKESIGGTDEGGGIAGAIQSMMNKFEELKAQIPTIATAITDANLGQVMTDAVNTMVNAVSGAWGPMWDATTTLVNAVSQRVTHEHGTFEGNGKNDIAGVIVSGLNSAQVDAGSFISNVCNAVRGGEGSFNSVGYWIALGIAAGINQGTPWVAAAARAAVQAAKRAAEAESVQGSPARLFFPTGYWMTAGIAVGIQNGIPLAEDAMRKAVHSAADAFEFAAQHESLTMGMAPSITPVISMSDVQADVNSLSAMLSPQSLTPMLSTNLGLEAVTEQNVSLQNDAVVNEVSKLRGEVQTYTEAVLTHIGSTYIDGISVNDNDAIHDTFIEMLYDLKRRAAMNGGR